MENQEPKKTAAEIISEYIESLRKPKKPLENQSPAQLVEWSAWFRRWTSDIPLGQQYPEEPAPFLTLGDPQLEAMLQVAIRFVLAVREKDKPHWMTFTGTSAAGKTFLAEAVYRWYKNSEFCKEVRIGEDVFNGCEKITWSEAVHELRYSEDKNYIHTLERTRLLFLDEIGGEHDTTGFATRALANLLEQRVKKWTIITSNLSLAQTAESSQRIATRLTRDRCEVVDVNTTPFNLRKL